MVFPLSWGLAGLGRGDGKMMRGQNRRQIKGDRVLSPSWPGLVREAI